MNQPEQTFPVEHVDAEQLAAIRRLVADAELRQHDLEPFLDLHTNDVVIVNVAGRRVLGKADLRHVRAAALASPLAQVRTRPEIVDIRAVDPGSAIVSCIKHVSDGRDPGARGSDSTRLPTTASLTYLVVRTGNGDWRIALAQTTPVATA